MLKHIKQLQSTLTALVNNESKPRARKSDYQYTLGMCGTECKRKFEHAALELSVDSKFQ